MRTFSDNLIEALLLDSQKRHIVLAISFDDTDTDIVYFTNHSDTQVPGGATVYYSCVVEAPAMSERVVAEEARTEIGDMSFSLIDHDRTISDLIKSKESANKGLRNRKVRFYGGAEDIAWADYALFHTYYIDGEVIDQNGKLVFNSKDVQRFGHAVIFEPKITYLSSNISDVATTIRVLSVTDFIRVYHDANWVDAPSQEVGYIKIDDEVIRYTGRNLSTGEFTGCTRGVLGTKAAVHEVDSGARDNNKKQVYEFVYIEGTIPWITWALCTGYQYNTSHRLPSHWTLRLSTSYLNSGDFINLTTHMWDTTDTSIGLRLIFGGVEAERGKDFISREVLFPGMLSLRVDSQGRWGLLPIAGILSDAPSVVYLNESTITKRGGLKHNYNAIYNKLQLDWDYSHVLKAYLRTNIVRDQTSIDIYGETKNPKVVKFRGLSGGQRSIEHINNYFDSIRNRLSGPQLEIPITVLPYFAMLEVGDIVRLSHANIMDFHTGTAIDRSFEVVQTDIDWTSGTVGLLLVGSSRKATHTFVTGESYAVPDAEYSRVGTNLATVLAGKMTGNVLTSSHTLTGGTSLTASSSIFYYLNDFTIGAGVTLSWTGNIQLRIMGNFTNLGLFTAEGGGIAGAASPTSLVGTEASIITRSTSITDTGGVGNTFGQGWIREQDVAGDHKLYSGLYQTGQGFTSTGAYKSLGSVVIEYDAVKGLTGIPSDLRGAPGMHGMHAGRQNYRTVAGVNVWYTKILAAGGAGGTSGGGAFVLCRGCVISGSGRMNTSGTAGSLGGTHYEPFVLKPLGSDYDDISISQQDGYHTTGLRAGSGAGGHPGGLYIAIDGNASAVPILSSAAGTFYAYNGESPTPPLRALSNAFAWWSDLATYEGSTKFIGSYYTNPYSSTDVSSAMGVVRYVASSASVQSSTPVYTDDASTVATEILYNTPKRPNADLVSVVVTVTPPSATNYSHSMIYWKLSTATDWEWAGIADDSYTIEALSANGTTYDIQARSVSITGYEAPAGPQTQVTLPNVTAVKADAVLQITVPIVRHLELIGTTQGETEFTGRHAKFQWGDSTDSEWVEVGSESLVSGSGSIRDQYFSHYEVSIYDPSTDVLLLTENITENNYAFTHEKNAESYKRINGTDGAYREFRIEVYRWSRLNTRSDLPAKLVVSNPAPGLPTGVSFTAKFQSFTVNYTKPKDLDWSGMLIWVSDTSGFSPSDSNLAFNGTDTPAEIKNLPTGEKFSAGGTYYFRYAMYDTFGQEGSTVSAEYSITILQIETVDLTGLGDWAFKVDPADAEFINLHLTGDAVESEKIANLTAAKLTAGVLLATVQIGTGGLFRATNPTTDYEVRMGFQNDEGTDYIFRYGNFTGASGTHDVPFSIDVNGNTIATGMTLKTGTGSQRIEINPSNDNELHFYILDDYSTSYEVLRLGLVNDGGVTDYVIWVDTTTVASGGGIYVTSYASAIRGFALWGVVGMAKWYGTAPGYGVWGYVYGTTNAGYGGYFASCDRIDNGAPIRLLPSLTSAAPTHTAAKGSLFVTSDGILYINTSTTTGTTWQKVGAQ